MTGVAISSGIRSAVKSIQHVTGSGAGTSANVDVTVTSVDTTKSVIVGLGITAAATGTYSASVMARFTSATNVRLNMTNGDLTTNCNYAFSIVEFY